jgi:tetratricopeptide (TPR) repeat protein
MNPEHTARKNRIVISFLLLLVTLGLYVRVHNFGFISYDDPFLFVNNPHVNSGLSWDNVIWAFTSTDRLHWMPLTWITHMIDFQIYGASAPAHHLTNLAIHLLNTALLLLFLYKATNRYWQSLFVAALFALHPLHVEPVAWIAARKDLLSSLFCFATLVLYVRYVERPGAVRYTLTVGMYILSLMAKPMMVTLPYLLLVLDYWPLQRTGFGSSTGPGPIVNKSQCLTLIYEKTPFIVASAAFALLAYLSQSQSNAVSTIYDVSLSSRAANVIVAYADYVWKIFWPAKLAVIYPYRSSLPAWEVAISALFLILVTAWVFRNSKDHRYLPAGWLWFLGTLLPVIGIIPIGHISMADRFTYIPMIGISIIIAWGVPELLKKRRAVLRPSALAASAIAVLLVLTIASWEYLSYWKDSLSLFSRAAAVTEGNFVSLSNIGAELEKQGKYDEAIQYYLESVRVEPKFDLGYSYLGYALSKEGDYYQALYYFTKATELNPDLNEAKIGLAICEFEISRRSKTFSKTSAAQGGTSGHNSSPGF